jgi:hypothetical protein
MADRELTLDEIEAMYARYAEIVEAERVAGHDGGSQSDEAYTEAQPLMEDCFHAVPALCKRVRHLELNAVFFTAAIDSLPDETRNVVMMALGRVIAVYLRANPHEWR